VLALLAEDDFAEVQRRRREWGADKLDEVWTGIHHLRPVGPHSGLQQAIAVCLHPLAAQRDLVPVLGAYDPREPGEHGRSDVAPPTLRGDQAASAVLVVEIVARAEDIHSQLSAFAADHVRELVIIGVETRTVDWLARVGGGYEPVDRSRLIDCSPAKLAEAMVWPKAAAHSRPLQRDTYPRSRA
jgi:hypothetical protein